MSDMIFNEENDDVVRSVFSNPFDSFIALVLWAAFWYV